MKRRHTVAARRIGRAVGVVAALGVGLAVPRVALALRHRRLAAGRIIDRQMQRHYAVAACHRGKRLLIVAARGVFRSVPRELFALHG